MATDDTGDETGGGPTQRHQAQSDSVDSGAIEDDTEIFHEAESVFAAFVRNANQLGHDPRTVRAALQRVAAATIAEATVTDATVVQATVADVTVVQATSGGSGAEELASEDDVEELPTGFHAAAARVQLIPPGKRTTDPESVAETRVVRQKRESDAPLPLLTHARWDDVETAKESGPGGAPVVLLTRRRTSPPETLSPVSDVFDTDVRVPAADEEMFVPASPRGLTTQRREARAVVPEVASVTPQARPVPERGEDGEVPPRELERLLSDMSALLRWGHEGQVRDELEKLRRRYPSDLLLMRRIAEFYLEVGQNEAAMDVLFALSGRLFERRNVEGMRAALEQVLVLDPGNARARKLLSLLVKRDSSPP